MLLPQRVAPRGELVDPRHHGVSHHPRSGRSSVAVHVSLTSGDSAISVQGPGRAPRSNGVWRTRSRARSESCPSANTSAVTLMLLAGDALDRVAPAIDVRLDVLDDDAGAAIGRGRRQRMPGDASHAPYLSIASLIGASPAMLVGLLRLRIVDCGLWIDCGFAGDWLPPEPRSAIPNPQSAIRNPQ